MSYELYIRDKSLNGKVKFQYFNISIFTLRLTEVEREEIVICLHMNLPVKTVSSQQVKHTSIFKRHPSIAIPLTHCNSMYQGMQPAKVSL